MVPLIESDLRMIVRELDAHLDGWEFFPRHGDPYSPEAVRWRALMGCRNRVASRIGVDQRPEPRGPVLPFKRREAVHEPV
jgi:hypothetical protein